MHGFIVYDGENHPTGGHHLDRVGAVGSSFNVRNGSKAGVSRGRNNKQQNQRLTSLEQHAFPSSATSR